MKQIRSRAARATAGAALLLGVAFGCASQRPVLYENATLEERGDAAAAEAIEECMAESKRVASSRTGRVVRETAKSGAVGGATGAVIGAIVGRPGTGAAVGAAGAATQGLLHGLFGARELDSVERGYVDRCLRERGYDPIGWR
jgi:outer membrane lipoprotein SlyB